MFLSNIHFVLGVLTLMCSRIFFVFIALGCRNIFKLSDSLLSKTNRRNLNFTHCLHQPARSKALITLQPNYVNIPNKFPPEVFLVISRKKKVVQLVFPLIFIHEKEKRGNLSVEKCEPIACKELHTSLYLTNTFEIL